MSETTKTLAASETVDEKISRLLFDGKVKGPFSTDPAMMMKVKTEMVKRGFAWSVDCEINCNKGPRIVARFIQFSRGDFPLQYKAISTNECAAVALAAAAALEGE